jgi:hypothetical protein
MGISSGLQEVEYYFQDLIGLFKDVDGEDYEDTTTPNLFEMMAN